MADGAAPQAELDTSVPVPASPPVVEDESEGKDDLLDTLLTGSSPAESHEDKELSAEQMEEALFPGAGEDSSMDPSKEYVPGSHGRDDVDLFLGSDDEAAAAVAHDEARVLRAEGVEGARREHVDAAAHARGERVEHVLRRADRDRVVLGRQCRRRRRVGAEDALAEARAAASEVQQL